MPLTRRSFLHLLPSLGAALSAPATSAPRHQGATAGVFAPSALQQDLEIYDALGIHRSGGTAEKETLDWLAKHWETCGFTTSRYPITVPNHDALYASLSWDNETVQLLGQPPFQTENEVAGDLVWLSHPNHGARIENRIAVASLPSHRHSHLFAREIYPFVQRAINDKASALILVTTGPSSEATLLNIRLGERLPLLAVAAPNTSDSLVSAAGAGKAARLVTPQLGGEHTAHNLIAELPATGPRIIVSTPISGWAHCAGERGPGVAAIRALASYLGASRNGYSITLIATTGHELGDLGIRQWLGHGAPSPDETALWVHLGAGWAARNWHDSDIGLLPMRSADPQRYLLATEDILSVAREKFRGQAGLESAYPLTPDTAAGELKEIISAGFKTAIGAFGAHRYHHTLQDRMNCTDGSLVAGPLVAFRDTINVVLST